MTGAKRQLLVALLICAPVFSSTSCHNGTERAAAPTGVTATPGDSQVTIAWLPVPGAESYVIYWGTASGVTRESGQAILEVTSPQVHFGLVNRTTYYYVVTAINIVGEGSESVEVSATPVNPTSPPGPPTGVSATPADMQVTIAWNPVVGATSFNIYWATSPGVTKATGTPILAASNPYVHLGLANGTAYYYVVTAVNAFGESNESFEVFATPMTPSGPPGPPTGVSATPADMEVTITWNPVLGADSYNIYWATSPGVTKVTGTPILAASNPYLHLGLANGTTFYYVVTSVNAFGESLESVEVSATPQPGPPSAPTGVVATPGDQQVTISWNPALGADSYNIYWATIAGVTRATGTRIIGVTSPHVHMGLMNGTTYFYVVTAVSIAQGEGPESAERDATPQQPNPTTMFGAGFSGAVLVTYDLTTGLDFGIGDLGSAVGTAAGLAYDRNSDTLYGINQSGLLFIVNQMSGYATPTFNTGLSTPLSLAYDPNTDTLYVGTSGSGVQTIDPIAQTTTSIGNPSFNTYGMAFDPNSNILYGIDASDGTVFTIDTTTAFATLVGVVGIGLDFRSLGFDPSTDTLYSVEETTDTLYAIDPTTGVGTPVGAVGSVRIPRVEGLAAKN